MHYHNPKLTQVANEMRHKPTAAEKKLWYALLKDYNPRFQMKTLKPDCRTLAA